MKPLTATLSALQAPVLDSTPGHARACLYRPLSGSLGAMQQQELPAVCPTTWLTTSCERAPTRVSTITARVYV